MKRFCIGVVLALTCAGCGGRRVLHLGHLKRPQADVVKAVNGVEARACVLGRKEVRHLLGGYSFTRRAELTCVHLTIQNTSPRAVLFDARRCSIKLLSDRAVAQHIFGDAASQGPILSPAGAIIAAPLVFIPSVYIFGVGALIGGIALNIPGAIIATGLLAAGSTAVIAYLRQDPVHDEWFVRQFLTDVVRSQLCVAPANEGSVLLFFRPGSSVSELKVPLTDQESNGLALELVVSLTGEQR